MGQVILSHYFVITFIDNEPGISYNFEYNGQKYVYRKNLQGDIVAILDECGCTRGTYEYDAWGNLLSQVGSEILNINPFRYRGYYYDAETGLYYPNSRYYDPEIGRFISPDRLENLDPGTINGLNLYVYSFANPVMVKHEYAASEMGLVPRTSLVAGNVGGDGNTTDTSWFSSALGILKTIVGSQSDIKSALLYMRAKGIHKTFPYATRTRYMFPILGSTWRYFNKSSSIATNFKNLIVGSVKSSFTGNAKAGAKALIGSFGKVVGITAAINAFFNLVENEFDIFDQNMWIDTAIDTAIGVSSYCLAVGVMSIVGAVALWVGFTLPGVIMIVGVAIFSWLFEQAIRGATGYQD